MNAQTLFILASLVLISSAANAHAQSFESAKVCDHVLKLTGQPTDARPQCIKGLSSMVAKKSVSAGDQALLQTCVLDAKDTAGLDYCMQLMSTGRLGKRLTPQPSPDSEPFKTMVAIAKGAAAYHGAEHETTSRSIFTGQYPVEAHVEKLPGATQWSSCTAPLEGAAAGHNSLDVNAHLPWRALGVEITSDHKFSYCYLDANEDSYEIVARSLNYKTDGLCYIIKGSNRRIDGDVKHSNSPFEMCD